MAGFSFTDEKEAGQFYKRVEQREKHAKSKGTKAPHTAAVARSATVNHSVGRENVPIPRSVSTPKPILSP